MANALFIGRFQPFHKGHMWVIEQYAKDYQDFIIAIGSSQFENTPKNPFSCDERIEMIQSVIKAKGIPNCHIMKSPDVPNDEQWVQNLMQKADFDVVLTSNEYVTNLFKDKDVLVKSVPIQQGITATDVRFRIATDKPWEHLVPKATLDVVNKCDGVNRIKKLRHKSLGN